MQPTTPDHRNLVPLPENAARCMELALPVLKRFFNMDRFITGGGSVLAAYWHHRLSTDVDLFTESREEGRRLYGVQDEIRAAFGEACGEPVPISVSPIHGNASLPGAATLEWSSVGRLGPLPTDPDFEPISGLPLDCPEEILAQKLSSRMFGKGRILVRDLYDLAWAADRAPDLLQLAARAMPRQDLRRMVDVLEDIRDMQLPIDRSKEIIAPADALFEFRALDVLCRGLAQMVQQPMQGNRNAGRGR